MLIEFSIANFRSFRDEVTFSMVASPLKTNGGQLDDRNCFAAPGSINLLSSAAIYGANASGKSNFVAAFDFMTRFVRRSHDNTERTGGIEVEPFRLNTETETEPSYFEVLFIVDDEHFRYGFEATSESVVTEWLHILPTNPKPGLVEIAGQEVKLFERDGNEIRLDQSFEEEAGGLEARTRPNALFLSVGAQFNGETAQKVLGWFRSIGIATSLGHLDFGMKMFTERMLSDRDTADEIVDLIKKMDLGIEAIQIERNAPATDPLPDYAPKELREAMAAYQENLNREEQVAVRTVHRKTGDSGQPVEPALFDLDEHESEGTRKLLAMAGPLVDTLKFGDILVIDELDARLHPLLTKEIVGLFGDPERNPNGAQLVFTTQDTNLLDPCFLRRDQIWFTEKDRQGASHLYSLVEFKIDENAPFERDYIQGRYGAIPYLGDVRQLFLEKD